MLLHRILSEFRLFCCNRLVSQIPSHHFRLAFYRWIMGFEIGKNSSIHLGARFTAARGLRIGIFSVINQDCRLDPRGSITIGDYTALSPEVTILTADHDPYSKTFEGRTRQVIIGNDVWIGTRAILLPGITVGNNVVVAAGAIVTKNVEPFTIVAGIPARKIGERPIMLNYGEKNDGYRRLFH